MEEVRADAQHLSAELVGRFEKERIGLKSIALNSDTSALTLSLTTIIIKIFFHDNLKHYLIRVMF